jgi:FlaA1/EpsC-like NDP-sugar epimerase
MFVLRMGEQVRILDLVEDLIRLSGLEPGKDIQIKFTGIRPGEKLQETLWDEGLEYEATEHPDIVQVENGGLLDGVSLVATIEELVRLAKEGDSPSIVGLLSERVPGSVLGQQPPPGPTAVL